jgi:hypothetical protein
MFELVEQRMVSIIEEWFSLVAGFGEFALSHLFCGCGGKIIGTDWIEMGLNAGDFSGEAWVFHAKAPDEIKGLSSGFVELE